MVHDVLGSHGCLAARQAAVGHAPIAVDMAGGCLVEGYDSLGLRCAGCCALDLCVARSCRVYTPSEVFLACAVRHIDPAAAPGFAHCSCWQVGWPEVVPALWC